MGKADPDKGWFLAVLSTVVPWRACRSLLQVTTQMWKALSCHTNWSLKSCSLAHWELVLSSPREHHMEPNTTAPGAMLFCVNSGWSSISNSGNSSLSGHSQSQSSGLTSGGLTFCPGYKNRHGIKHSCKYLGVRESRLQTQHSSKERTCNTDVMKPATWPGSFLSAKR